jgi:uncharacterized protein (DUF1330 family)
MIAMKGSQPPFAKRRYTVMTTYKLVLALVVGTALGAAADGALKAQGKSPAGYYFIEEEITDPDTFSRTVLQIVPTVAMHNGRYLVRGGKIISHTGEPPKRLALIAFDSVASAERWYDSKAFTDLRATLAHSGRIRDFVVEGIPD